MEVRASDRETAGLLTEVGDDRAMAALEAERSLVRALGGDCHVPIGALATVDGDTLRLDAVVASLDGSRLLRRQASGPMGAASALGRGLATEMLDDGADAILAPHRT
jgi:hydroxymethylbilane synthase